mmetsp:Transcript_29995/g.48810  ORF Transcript_29995/g.48810 Transcript_29995/m.48810 type:complete len:81 (-) Transcript_29995:295-537(-)
MYIIYIACSSHQFCDLHHLLSATISPSCFVSGVQNNEPYPSAGENRTPIIWPVESLDDGTGISFHPMIIIGSVICRLLAQ